MSEKHLTDSESSQSVSEKDIQKTSGCETKSVEIDSRLIRVKDAPAHISVSKSHYHNLKNPKSPYFQCDFPRTVQISLNCKGHHRSELDAWLDSKGEG